MMTEQSDRVKLSRDEIIDRVLARDGSNCYHPDCGKPFRTIDGEIDREDVTIDHWIPLAKGGTWDLDNLRLMHKPCNARKSDILPLNETDLPVREKLNSHAERRAQRARRVEVCPVCESGRKLGPEEQCSSCGSGPKPDKFPRWAKVDPKECDHDDFWCWACSIGLYERKPIDIARIIMGP